MTSPGPHASERRRSPRVPVADRAYGHALALAQDVIIHDISLGGFLIESPEAFPAHALHQFRIAAKNGAWTTMLTAKSLHSRPKTAVAAAPSYLTGFSFVQPLGLDAQQCLHALVGQPTSVLTF